MPDNILPFIPPKVPMQIAVRWKNADGTERTSFRDVSVMDLLAIGVVVNSSFVSAEIFPKVPESGEAA